MARLGRCSRLRPGPRIPSVLLVIAAAAAGCATPYAVPEPVAVPPPALPGPPVLEPAPVALPLHISIQPAQSSAPVCSTRTLVATVTDAQGRPVAGQRVDWVLTVPGTGQILAADQSAPLPWLARRTRPDFAITYTTGRRRRITFGTPDPRDDLCLAPGQTWCLVGSSVEGDTRITALAPTSASSADYYAVAVCHWVDATWQFPAPASSGIGGQYTFRTRLARVSDGRPLPGYTVRYRIAGGPPASFTPGGSQEVETVTDSEGIAEATITQDTPQAGTNQVTIEVYRPAPSETAALTLLASGQTQLQWLGAQLTVQKQGPPTAYVGAPITYTITVTNSGAATTGQLHVVDTVPDGLSLIEAEPAATHQDGQLTWELEPIEAGQSRTIHLTMKTDRPGCLTNSVQVTGPDGLRAEHSVQTQVRAAALQVQMTGPARATVGQTVTYQIVVTNSGSVTLRDIRVIDRHDPGLEHEKWGQEPVTVTIDQLAPGQSRELTILLKGTQPGTLCNHAAATAAGQPEARAESCTTFFEPGAHQGP